MFSIWDKNQKTALKDGEGETRWFETASAAATWFETYYGRFSDHQGRFQLREGANDINWRDRERKRFEDGTYVCPEWLMPHSLIDHFLHLSTDKSNLLAYTQNDEKGKADVQSRVSFKGYFEKHHKKMATTTYITLEKLYSDLIGSKDAIKFATTPEAIVEVYTNFDHNSNGVAGSCMRGNGWNGLPFHPTYVYGAGDLAVAYLVNDHGQTTHRALCWPEKKLHSRVYGTSLLNDKLRAAGYSRCRYYGSEYTRMSGARLLAVPIEGNPNVYLMPYIDEESHARLSEDGKYLSMIAPGEAKVGEKKIYSCRSQNGATGEYTPVFRCARCNNVANRPILVHTQSNPNIVQHWCRSCTTEETVFRCKATAEFFSKQSFQQIIMHPVSGGGVWADSVFAQHGFTCPVTKKNYNRSHGESVLQLKGEYALWSLEGIRSLAWRCEKSGALMSDECEKVEVINAVGRLCIWNRLSVDMYAEQVDTKYIERGVGGNPTVTTPLLNSGSGLVSVGIGGRTFPVNVSSATSTVTTIPDGLFNDDLADEED